MFAGDDNLSKPSDQSEDNYQHLQRVIGKQSL
jgi:hypothetical protein